ncbi:MAG: hypothetical protein OXT06_15355, partial [Rhodospirillaceae bacterium]|nr:hypothetical protein [Rhodospirillaceae bacterium]
RMRAPRPASLARQVHAMREPTFAPGTPSRKRSSVSALVPNSNAVGCEAETVFMKRQVVVAIGRTVEMICL